MSNRRRPRRHALLYVHLVDAADVVPCMDCASVLTPLPGAVARLHDPSCPAWAQTRRELERQLEARR